MTRKAVYWALVAMMAVFAVLLLNYWASYQALSTLAYCGIVVAACGLANLAFPFRFLGVRRRAVGAVVLVGGSGLALAALLWPASLTRVAQRTSRLDDVMPEFQFRERHAVRVHAPPDAVMQAIRESTVGDLRSYITLMKIRGAVLRRPYHGSSDLRDVRVLDVFSSPGSGFYRLDDTGREIVMGGVGYVRARERPEFDDAAGFAAFQDEGAVKIAFNLTVDDAGDGWSAVGTETRVMALGDSSRRVMGCYWRLIVPGSGLLRRQWLEGIAKRAERASLGA